MVHAFEASSSKKTAEISVPKSMQLEITFENGKKKMFPADILVSKSEYFRGHVRFEGEKLSNLSFVDIRCSVFSVLIDHAQNEEDLMKQDLSKFFEGSIETEDEEPVTIFDLLYLSNQLFLHSLRRKYEKVIEANMTPELVSEVLEATNDWVDSNLRQFCVSYMIRFAKQVEKTEPFKNLSKETIKKLFAGNFSKK